MTEGFVQLSPRCHNGQHRLLAEEVFLKELVCLAVRAALLHRQPHLERVEDGKCIRTVPSRTRTPLILDRIRFGFGGDR